ncbi:DExH-box ATP-dependent RNA helicase DExH7 [Populus alba x Populus x berolinensis]|nr:DExH-box ATP-dependent RNA helicase DExH7 [Populus alba x Populus x berolinensis]
MAPKKNPQRSSSNNKASSSKSKSSSNSGPRLQISAENENRLRRLLLNSTTTPPLQTTVTDNTNSLSKAQKAKKLKNIYEKLSCEGFSNDHIELALSSLKDNATFETALDWLCLNLAGNELPLKFSGGTSLNSDRGSVSVVSTAREDWVPYVDSSRRIEGEEEQQRVLVRTKARWDEEDGDGNVLDFRQPSQADWIRQYVEQQEEEESKTWEDDSVDGSFTNKDPQPRTYDVIAKEYHAVRLEATKAKEKGDKKSQEQAGHVIRKLKQEIFALGLSLDLWEQDFGHQHVYEDMFSTSTPCEHVEAITSFDVEGDSTIESIVDENDLESSSSIGFPLNPVPPSVPLEGEIVLDESEDVEIGDFFIDDASPNDALSPGILEIQKREKMRELCSEKNLEKLEGIWKKGDLQKIPKAVLHQLCQKSGWEAPKFNKVLGRELGFSYAVSILRKASGRGKSRKAGGLITLQLPDQDDTFQSAEDAQNRVAAFALHQLFPDLPIHLAIINPYSSLVLQWKQGETSKRVEDSVEDRRAGFVDLLLKADGSSSSVVDATTSSQETLKINDVEETKDSGADAKVERKKYAKDAESSYLRQQQESKRKLKKYKDMLCSRAALPIAGLKVDILQMLKENDVLVVCGETGSGKTTQVPQFILDDMIESGHGGNCNIICTQPRRIAAISVAERVADERCEPSPGAVGSLVGYQVRLDSARNEKTKLLFCTTGILLRKLAGDRSLSGITHVIVDEVHERSLLGDFLLIVLKNLIEKQSSQDTPKLKVILMSATVDSNLFSRYFGQCPVLTAQGRTHPVTNYFLEDIYEYINYKLASDAPAALRYETSAIDKNGPVDNHRGKKNLVLSAWGDDSQLSEDCVNPHYISTSYQTYSEQTQKNLKRLNEEIIDYDLLEDLICYVDETCGEGAILIFLPGVSEIYMLLDRLVASYRFGGPSSDWVLPLHSSIASKDQKKVFLWPPENIRKKLTSMVEDWISQANARQRRGRAGRVKPGICFCLYTRHRFEKLMRPYQVPEMLRMPLVELSLQIKLLSLGHIKPFLSKALEPPREEAMTSAISLLYEVGALEGDEQLTPLGHHLAKLPVDVLIGKMLLYGAIFGCLSPILSISAFLSYKSPFVYPKDEKQNVERAKLALLADKIDGSNDSNYNDRLSDHLLMMVAYKKWEKILSERGFKAAQQFCATYFLSSSVMHMIRDMRTQFGTLLADIGLISIPKSYQVGRMKKENLDSWLSEKSQPFNMYSHHSSLVKAILCAGLYPNVAATEQGITAATLNGLKQSSRPGKKGHPIWYDGRREVHIHPSSVNCNMKAFPHPFLVFLEKVETNKVFLRDTTIISPFSILLFGGAINIQHQTGLLTIDGWLKLTASAQYAVLFKELRSTLHALLKELIRKPENATLVDNEVVKSMIQLLLDEDKPQT